MLTADNGATFDSDLEETPSGWLARYLIVSKDMEQLKPQRRLFPTKADAVAWLAAEATAHGFDYETGASRKPLTGTDTVSWHDKAWVVGITVNGQSKAYDWNRLRRERVINDVLGGKPIVLALASDTTSFFAFVRPNASTTFAVRHDSLAAGSTVYAFTGQSATGRLEPLSASQEFWHSWRTFQPATTRY